MSGTLFIGEQRRFRRMSLPLKTRILPKHPLSGKAIKSWGIDYFPPAIQAQCQTTLETLKTQIAQIHEHHDLIEALTSEAVDQITFFWTAYSEPLSRRTALKAEGANGTI